MRSFELVDGGMYRRRDGSETKLKQSKRDEWFECDRGYYFVKNPTEDTDYDIVEGLQYGEDLMERINDK